MTTAKTLGAERGDTLIALDPIRRNPYGGLADHPQVLWRITEIGEAKLEVQSANPDGTPTDEIIHVPLDENAWQGIIFHAVSNNLMGLLRYPTLEEYQQQLNAPAAKGYKGYKVT